jgi:hypothetical protein
MTMLLNLAEYPQLADLCWSRIGATIEESDAFAVYESGWRFVDQERLSREEQSLISELTERYGNGVLNV